MINLVESDYFQALFTLRLLEWKVQKYSAKLWICRLLSPLGKKIKFNFGGDINDTERKS